MYYHVGSYFRRSACYRIAKFDNIFKEQRRGFWVLQNQKLGFNHKSVASPAWDCE